MNFRTYEDLSHIINNNLHKIPEEVDLIVGIPKSGIMVASIIALHLNLPLTDIDSLLEGKIYQSGSTKKRDNWIKDPKDARKILIVDDSSISGNSIKKVKETMKNYKYKNKLVYLVALATNYTAPLVDIYLDICESPRMFEWNYMHHAFLENACVDIDGVLCQDPTEEENDDGKNYKRFISNVKPRVIPTRKIGYLVTTRLEKYRKQTENWLKKNNIKYDKLIMLDLPSKEERIKLGNHGKYKGEQYKKLKDTIIFIESDPRQAIIIAKISGKPVFCVGNSKFYTPQETIDNTSQIRKIYRKIVPLKIRKRIKNIIKK